MVFIRPSTAKCTLGNAAAAMVIVWRNATVNEIPRISENPDNKSISAFPRRLRPKRVYIPFIAILKLPFKFDRP
jgi:hypothetical protein